MTSMRSGKEAIHLIIIRTFAKGVFAFFELRIVATGIIFSSSLFLALPGESGGDLTVSIEEAV